MIGFVRDRVISMRSGALPYSDHEEEYIAWTVGLSFWTLAKVCPSLPTLESTISKDFIFSFVPPLDRFIGQWKIKHTLHTFQTIYQVSKRGYNTFYYSNAFKTVHSLLGEKIRQMQVEAPLFSCVVDYLTDHPLCGYRTVRQITWRATHSILFTLYTAVFC